MHTLSHTQRHSIDEKSTSMSGGVNIEINVTKDTHLSVIVRIVRESEQPATPRMCTHHHMTAMFITGPAVADAMPPCGVLSAGGR